MSVVPLIFNGMQGSTEVHPHSLIPSTGFITKAESNRDPFNYQPYIKAPVLFSADIDYSSRRGVLQCNGLGHTVLRRPPIPSTNGMVPSSGIGRHQMKGLVFDSSKPINARVMPLASSVAAGMNNPLGQPA